MRNPEEAKSGRYLKPKKKLRKLDVIMIIVGLCFVAVFAVMVWFYYKYQSIPDTLCVCAFGALTGECGISGVIKTKDKDQKNQEEKNYG